MVDTDAAFVRAGDPTGQMLTATLILETQFAIYGDFTATDPWTEALEALLVERLPFPDVSTEIQVYSILMVALTFRAPWHDSLSAYAARAMDLIATESDPTQRMLAAGQLSWYYSWTGDFERARQARAVALPLLDRIDILPVRKASAMSCMAFFAYARGDAAESDTIIARAFETTRQHGLVYTELWMRLSECWHRLVRGEFKAVASILVGLEHMLVPTRYLDASLFHYVSAWLASAEGNLQLGLQKAESSLALALAIRSGAAYGESFVLLLAAQIHIELGHPPQTNRYIEDFRAKFDRVASPLLEFDVLLVEAFAAHQQGEDARCSERLRMALAIGRANGYWTSLVWNHRMLASLCMFALEHDTAEYCNRSHLPGASCWVVSC